MLKEAYVLSMRRGRRWSMDSEKMTATPVLIVHKTTA
jgi:hypothetical protein